MGKLSRKKKRVPITAVRLKKTEKKTIISRLHQLNKEKCSLQQKEKHKEDIQKLSEIEDEIQKLGGLNAYQMVSKTAESLYGNFNSNKWIISKLKKLERKEGAKLKLLDVGALDLNYETCKSWIDSTAIDLNPQKPGILKADFLTYQSEDSEVYDVIVLSLVLNFAGDPQSRGDMLVRAQQLCKEGGHVFIVLPLACVQNSRYMTKDLLNTMMASLGLASVSDHESNKLTFHMYIKQTDKPTKKISFSKTKLRDGKNMNNFCIILNKR